MIKIGEAQQKVLEDIPVLGRERIHILEALGRVLAQDVTATRDVPSADNSAMDGFCCRRAGLGRSVLHRAGQAQADRRIARG